MTDSDFADRMRHWRALKPLLIRSLGHEGAARWMEHAAVQVRQNALRLQKPIEVFPVRPGSPESVL